MEPLCFLNSFSERGLDVAGSRLSLRIGQHFRPNGIRHVDFIGAVSACYQSLPEDAVRIRGLSALARTNRFILPISIVGIMTLFFLRVLSGDSNQRYNVIRKCETLCSSPYNANTWLYKLPDKTLYLKL